MLQGKIAPQVREDIALGGVKRIGTRHLSPFLPKHLSVSIFNLIIVGEGRYRMLSGFQGRRLQDPMCSILCRHQQVILLSGTV